APPASGNLSFTLPACFATGPYPIEITNPDGQSGFFFSLEITSSADAHLNFGSWEGCPVAGVSDGFPQMATPRWRHAAEYGFDELGHAYIYVTGGQDGSNAVLASTELTAVDVFGTPGPWQTSLQFTGVASAPRAPNL